MVKDSNGEAGIYLRVGNSWRCECGKEHPVGAYAAAHWEIELVHVCECGRQHVLQNGWLVLVKGAKKAKKPSKP